MPELSERSLLVPQDRTGLGVIFCADLGTNFGWCDVSESGKIRSGHLHFPTKQFPRRGLQYKALRSSLIRYRAALEAEGQHVSKAYYEVVQFSADNGLLTLQLWAGFEAIFTSFWESHNVEPIGVPVGGLKTAATGHGDAPKDEAGRTRMNEKRAARKKPIPPYDGPTVQGALTALGFTFESGDEADSQALMLHALAVEREEMNV